MASSKNVSRPILPKKRPVDDASACDVEKSRKPKTVASKYPSPKMRTGVQVVRHFPPSCGVKEEPVGRKVERNPLKNASNFDSRRSNPPSFASRPTGKVKFWDPTEDDAKKPKVTITVTGAPLENDELKSFRPKEMGAKNPSFGPRPAGMVKFSDPNFPEEGDAQRSKGNTAILSLKEQVRREKIKEAMSLFDKFNRELYELNRSRLKEEKMAHWRVSVEAAKKVQQKLKWMDAKKTLGSICGVRIGDKFKYRSQLKMIGLHCQIQSGIDYTMIEKRNLAISIVDAHRYSNQRRSCDDLYYSGHGGKQLLPEDQKLERGNLSLKNSMIERTPVRVIRKLQGVGNEEAFVYDGLYVVEDYTQKKGEQGKMVFMFRLRRKPGQPQLHQMLNGSSS